ncbi:hypothetical protein C450_20596 [Halococcus salifodinae DSM 8989]|uniref:Uncharacterized protein n=1 Tax=Halococcus salifodinae DSM 8989 TaxID=1227456 RepID=M0MQ42_9EURY|nr:hypothetical protein C450_20596 [Halococcus salifodinae DSM 8989]
MLRLSTACGLNYFWCGFVQPNSHRKPEYLAPVNRFWINFAVKCFLKSDSYTLKLIGFRFETVNE